MAVSRLGAQVAEVVAALHEASLQFALIGGLALASYRVVRATQDIDLLVDLARADDVERVMSGLGYQAIHRSEDAANYVRGPERTDFLFARRPIARRLLASAKEIRTTLGVLRVVSAEGLVGFKLQAFVNDASRTQDVEDIRALLRANRGILDMSEVREYFALFDREDMLDDLLGDKP